MKKCIIFLAFLFAGSPILKAQGALKAEFYNGTNFETYIGTSTVSNIDFYWNDRPPIRGLNPHVCSVRYSGLLKTPKEGTVHFSARVDDGIRVWVNDVLIIDNWQLNDVGISDGKLHMEADVHYNFKIEYFNALNEAELRLLWKLPEDPDQNWLSKWWNDQEPEIIPATYFWSPIKEEVLAEVEPEPATPVLVPKSGEAPTPKPIIKPKPKPVQTPKPEFSAPKKEPITSVSKKITIDTLQKYIPKSVEFDQAKSEILSVSYAELNRLADFLVKNPARKLMIEGHTDYVGDADANLLLSERRAKAIAAFLIKKGVKKQQIISAIGYGGSKPLVKSDDEEYHPENRRVEFVIE